jgi:hypothetical protein
MLPPRSIRGVAITGNLEVSTTNPVQAYHQYRRKCPFKSKNLLRSKTQLIREARLSIPMVQVLTRDLKTSQRRKDSRLLESKEVNGLR